MALELTKEDREKIIGILEGKIPDDKLNDVMGKIDVATTYYAHGDSLYNKPTFGKVLILFMLIFVMWKFMIAPVFFGENASVAEIRDAMLQEAKELGAEPSLVEFGGTVQIEQPDETKKEYIVNIRDKNGESIGITDVKGNQPQLIVLRKTKAGSLKREDEFLSNISNMKVNKNQSEIIKKIMIENIEVPKYETKFESLDYGVDTIINAK